MKYDIVEDNIKIGNKIIYDIDKDILSIIHSLEHEIQELKEKNEELNKKLYLCTPETPQNSHRGYKNYVDLVNEIVDLEKQLKQRDEVIDKAINKLYEWGEALNPKFQKIMLDILKKAE